MKPFILSTLLFFICCQNQIAMPPNASLQYSNWFLTPTKSLEDSLVHYKDFLPKLDSLSKATTYLERGKAGACTTVLIDTFHSQYTMGWKTPTLIKQDTTYPLIIYLHGGTGTMLTTKGEFAYDMLSPLADTFNLFLASPSANRQNPWWSPAGMARILQTVRFMTLHYPINPDKIFLAGVSDGATGCYAAANTICSPFAGFIAVSGYGGMLFNMGMNLYPQNLMQRPILNINAGHDQIYNIEEVRKFIDWLLANGVNVEKTEYPDEKHGFDYRAKEFGHLAQCIRTWSKPHNINTISWHFVPGFPNAPDNCISWETDPKETDKQITAYWIKDTLQVKSKGLASVNVSFPATRSNNIFYSLNGNKSSKVSRLTDNTSLILKQIQYTSFPIYKPQSLYNVKITK